MISLFKTIIMILFRFSINNVEFDSHFKNINHSGNYKIKKIEQDEIASLGFFSKKQK